MAQTKECPICGATYERRPKEGGTTWHCRVACSKECAKVRKDAQNATYKAKAKAKAKAEKLVIMQPSSGTLRNYEPPPVPEHLRNRIRAIQMIGAMR
jgi:ribosomal protein L37AE/L43A